MKLDEFTEMMTGHFDNKEQFDKMQAEGKTYPYAEHVNTICNDKIKNLPDIGYSVLNQYPNIEDRRLLDTALALSNHNSFYKYHVFHVDKYKVNNWYLYWLAEQYPSYEDVSRGLYALKKQKDKSGFITVASYKRFLDRYLKI